MTDSIRLGRISGIPIGLHWSIAIIAGIFTLSLASTILPASAPGFGGAVYVGTALAVTVALLASIVAHELGHSIVAQNNDVGVSGITLFALGGVAKLKSEPTNPGAAARIALAGPAVSVIIGLLALAAAAAAGFVSASAIIVAALTWLGLINLSLAVFNMLPALPLDGGRALQAALWKRSGDRDQATISAASVGRYIGWAIVAFGAWRFLTVGSGLWTMVIGWFILSSAKAESLQARFHQHRETAGQPIHQFWPPPRPEDRQASPFDGSPSAFASTGTTFDLRNQAPPTRAPFGSPTEPPSPPSSTDQVIDVRSERVR